MTFLQLCYQDPYREDIYVHEVAHGIHLIGSDRTYRNGVQNAYAYAKQNNLWTNTYALYDYREYYAEGVQSFFNYEGGRIEARVRNIILIIL